MSEWNEVRWRKEYRVCTLVIFLTGSVIYGLVGAIVATQIPVTGQRVKILVAVGLGGGYFFFSLLSGILCSIRMVGRRSLKGKITLSIFWFIPVWFAVAGIFYSIPYGIYNCYRLSKLKEEGKQDADS